MTITPVCESSAISFKPSSLTFSNYSQTGQSFRVVVANGLSGSFNVTFTKEENSTYTFYSDIQYITLNAYTPTSKYSIKIKQFTRKSVGRPIKVRIQLEVPSPTQFALLTSTNCSNNFIFSPAQRIDIPADTTLVIFTVTYNGTTIPAACTQNFSIASLTSNNYEIKNPTVYYSSKISIDKTSVQRPMLLRLTSTSRTSIDVGASIISSTSSLTADYKPTVYKLLQISLGSNTVNYTATTSYIGAIYYAIVKGGTPNSQISHSNIYNNSVSSGLLYGEASAETSTQGVNTLANFLISGLKAQTSYKIAIYLNSTVGNSPIFFKAFRTKKASNAAAIKLAMSAPLGVGGVTT